MSRFSGKQYKGAKRNAKDIRRSEAEFRQNGYVIPLNLNGDGITDNREAIQNAIDGLLQRMLTDPLYMGLGPSNEDLSSK